jgi:ornithine carbamoyltransferase
MSTTATRPQHVLALGDLTAIELHAVLDLAVRLKAQPLATAGALAGRTLAVVAEEDAFATEASVAAAAHRLGLGAVTVGPGQLADAGHAADAGRVLGTYAAAIVARTRAQRTAEELASACPVPVVGGGTDEHHPLQALADLLTLRERHGRLAGLKVAWVGPAGRVTHSLLQAGALAGLEVVVVCPPDGEPDGGIFAGAEAEAELHGGSVRMSHDPADVAGADAVCTGADLGGRDRRLRVDRELLSRVSRRAGLLHCLPARRGVEVAAAALDGPASLVWEQAANRLPTAQALLYALLTGDWTGEELSAGS